MSRRQDRPAVPRDIALAAKRAMDISGSAAALLLLAPVLAWIGVAVLATQGRPMFFRSLRTGRHGSTFTMYKFRTMRAPRPNEVWFETDEQRVTRLGRFLRATSLDELPEFWNVLRGEMSLVGPRPLLPEYLGHYTSRERRRLDMRPGFTGWAAVQGRHSLRFEDRLELDAWYVDNWGLGLDVRILLMTVSQVLRRADVATTQDLDAIEFPERFRQALAAGPGVSDEVRTVDSAAKRPSPG